MCQMCQEVLSIAGGRVGAGGPVRPNPPTPFPEGEGGDSDEGICLCGYAVGKGAAELHATHLCTA
jgi:hypothetical protein